MKLFNILIFVIVISAINFTVAVDADTSTITTTEEITLTPGPVTCEYKTKDISEDYDENSDVNITCSGASCSVNGSGASMNNGILSIISEGTYIIGGYLEGQIKIQVNENDFVHLVLNNINIISNDGPAIYGVSANKITITIIGENSLIDSTNYTVIDEEPDACLFIDSDLSINGSGSISVTGNYGDAIRCKKDLKLVRGNIIIPSAVQRGIKAKNSICIKDGTIDVTSSNSGIKVTRNNNSEKGYIVIDGGNIAISSGKDALHAETHLTINDGFIDIKDCVEGIEGQMIDILGGEIHVMATDDGINASKISNSNDETSNDMNGNMNSDKKGGMGGGMPGNSSSSNDGSVYINIVGGKTYVTVQGNDVDGIDSNGILYIGGEAEVYSSIEGGDIYGNMAALDADGNNNIVGGATVIALGGSNSSNSNGMNGDKMEDDRMRDDNNHSLPNDANDTNSTITIDTKNANSSMRNQIQQLKNTSNTDVNNNINNNTHQGPSDQNGSKGMGGMGGMERMNESGNIYQSYIKTTLNTQEAGSQITVKDNNDNVIISFTPDISYSSILITTPSIVADQTYTIITGNESITAIASEAATGSVNSPSVTSSTNTSSTSDGNIIKPKLIYTIVLTAIFILF